MESVKSFEVGDVSPACNKVEEAFELLSRKWMGLVIRTLIDGEKYFCDLEAALPALSARVLTVRLQELAEAGLVERRVHDQTPVRVSYRLTPRGEALRPVMVSIAEWAHVKS